MTSANLFLLFQHRLLEGPPERVFLTTETGREVSVGEIEHESARYAALIRRLGVAPGERVAVQVEKSVEALVLYLACLRAGVIYLPLNSAYRESEIGYFLQDAAPQIVVCAPNTHEWVAPICARLGVAYCFDLGENANGTWLDALTHAEAEVGAAEFLRAGTEVCARARDDLAAILYTSGTTGRSKGAMITHHNLASNATTLHQYWGFRAGDVLVHALPLFHVHGLFVACHCALLNGGRMIFHTRFEPRRVIAALAEATVFMGVPTMYVRLLADADFTQASCRNMRLFISGSAPLLAETFDAFRQRTGHTILERYGMTETGMLTSNPLDGERRGGTVGPALPGVSVRVVDDAGLLLPHDEIGHIQVKGDNVLPGYWQMPEKNLEEFTSDGYFKTGDVGKLDTDAYVTIVGRSKDLVITGGYNVYPKEIELLIDELPGVVESAVIGLPHPDFGEAVAAVVVTRAEAALSEQAVVQMLKGQLANFKVPKRVFLVAELPRNTMGKVQKNELRQRYGATFVV